LDLEKKCDPQFATFSRRLLGPGVEPALSFR
jgi:hypothetical protein